MTNKVGKSLKNAAIAMVFVLGVSSFIGAATIGTAERAEAATLSNVYVSFPTWLGNCPSGGSVYKIYATIGNIWTTPPLGDTSDDLVYPKVYLYQWNKINVQLFCKRPWWKGGNYRGPAYSASFYPTRSGQTFWIGPVGQSNN